MKWLRNKRAISVLIWSFCALSLYKYFDSLMTDTPESYIFVPLSIITAFGLALFFPLVDGFGRYKVIHVSILIMWVSSILTTS